MARTTDYSGIEISARTTGSKGARILTVYVSAPYFRDIEESGIGRANLLAHKRGYSMLGGVTVSPVEKSAWNEQYQAKIEYTARWRGRSTLDRR